MKIKGMFVALVLALMSLSTSACYLWKEVPADTVGVRLKAGQVQECIYFGPASSGGWFDDFIKVKRSTVTFTIEDPEVITYDNQPIGARITIQARRKDDCESVKNLLQNWSALQKDDKLIETITATAFEGLKNGVRGFTLMQLLDDRNGLALAVATQLEQDASKYSVDIVNVTIANISASPEYTKLLQDRANITAQTDLELRRQDLIKQQAANNKLEQDQRTQVLGQQLLAEQAKTKVDVEIASREGKKIAVANQVYLDNEAAFQLERLRITASILGDKAMVWMLPENANLTLLLNNLSTTSPVVPVPANPPAPQ